MANILIVAYLLIVLALIAVILLQRSEGGGLGMGSSNSNGLVTVRGSANLLTRTTAILAGLFFAFAIGLTILSELDRSTSSILDQVQTEEGAPATTVLDAMERLQEQSAGDLPVPAESTGTDEAPAPAAAPETDAADPGLAVPEPATPAETPAAEPATQSEAPSDAAADPVTDGASDETTQQPAAPSN